MTEQERLQEIEEIKKWLDDHDYIVIKYVCGEYQEDDTTWCWYLNERRTKKNRLKELSL
jgi:hypothetical protein